MEFITTAEEDGKRLDELLAARVPGVSRIRLRKAIESREARVNGEARASGSRVRAGDRVLLDLDPDTQTAMTPEPLPLSILHEDADLILVEKPSGIVVHPAGRHRSGTLANGLAHHFNVAGGADPPIRPGIVHRLDKDTSGPMVVAKNQAALRRLTMEFQEKRVEKRYLALVHGSMTDDEGVWEAPIGYAYSDFPRWGIREDGRPGVTRYRVRERLPAHTLLELEPVTGRTNQLRLHCAHFGHPIVGDVLFGRGAEDGAPRLFLHAYLLGFRHPVTGEVLRFEAALPLELADHLACVAVPFAGREAHPCPEVSQGGGFSPLPRVDWDSPAESADNDSCKGRNPSPRGGSPVDGPHGAGL